MPRATSDHTRAELCPQHVPFRRRRLLSALAGAAFAGAALVVATPTTASAELSNADAELLALCKRITEAEAEAEAYGFGPSGKDLDTGGALMGQYWAVADRIHAIPARTPEGLRAKARAAASVCGMLTSETDGCLRRHVEGLARDLAGAA